MFQHVVRWTLLLTLWRKGRPYFFGTLLAVASILIVRAVHGEFVDYLQIAHQVQDPESRAGRGTDGPDWLFYSFALKWGLYLVIATLYLFYLRAVARRVVTPVRRGVSTSAGVTTARTDAAAEGTETLDADDAAFDFLRDKSRLETRGEQLLRQRSTQRQD